jgi:hypothetical protein
MNIEAYFASLGAALLARLSSVGAALAAGFATILMSFSSDERQMLLDVKQHFHDKYTELKAGGASEIDAIEGAGTAAWNTFCADETAIFNKEKDATITLLVSSAKSAAGIVKAVVTGG